jgi:hypothetical protein
MYRRLILIACFAREVKWMSPSVRIGIEAGCAANVVARFWIGALVFALFALTTLKLR